MTPPPSPTGSGFWSPSAWYCAEVTHILGAALIVLGGVYHGYLLWPILFGVIVAAAIKEFLIDISAFEGDSLWGSCQDFFFYCWGAAGATVAAAHFWWGASIVIGGVLLCMLIDMWRNAKLKNSMGRWVPWRDKI